MKKTLIVGAAVAAVSLAGCSAAENVSREVAQAVAPWEDELRAYMDQEMANTPQSETEDMCLGLTWLGLDTPEKVGAFVLAIDESGELPPASMTIGDYMEQTGETLPLNIPADVTVLDVMTEAGAYMLDACDVSY